MRPTIVLAALAAAAAPAVASAQSVPTQFLGFRAQALVGLDRFMARSKHDNALMYSVGGGFDGLIGDKILAGADFTYGDSKAKVCRRVGLGNGTTERDCTRANREFGVAAKLGYQVTPQLAFYGRGGWSQSRHRKSYDNLDTGASSGERYDTDGYQVGGGTEFSFTKNLFANVEYRYYNWHDNSSRHSLLGGVGVRFF